MKRKEVKKNRHRRSRRRKEIILYDIPNETVASAAEAHGSATSASVTSWAAGTAEWAVSWLRARTVMLRLFLSAGHCGARLMSGARTRSVARTPGTAHTNPNRLPTPVRCMCALHVRSLFFPHLIMVTKYAYVDDEYVHNVQQRHDRGRLKEFYYLIIRSGCRFFNDIVGI